jgi:AraC-like DNA-binding protein
MNKTIIETDISKALKWTGNVHIDNQLVLLDDMKNSPFPHESRRMNFIIMGLCEKGHAEYNMDTQRQVLNPGQVVLISERHIIDSFKASPDLEGVCMLISVPFYNEIMRNVSDISAMFLFAHNHPVFTLPERDQRVFRNYFDIIKLKASDKENHFRYDLVRTLLLAMFYDMSNIIYRYRDVKEGRQTRSEIIFTQFIKLVGQNYRQERRVSWYAEQLDITPKYLSEMVKQVSKRTPNEWIDTYVTLELRVLLKNTTLSIRDIATELNFPNQSFLGKYFKEHAGISPSRFRKS